MTISTLAGLLRRIDKSRLIAAKVAAVEARVGLGQKQIWRLQFLIDTQKERDRHNGRSPQFACLAFGNNWRRRRGFALAVVPVVLCAASDAKESQRRSRQ
jgi:hypothetical protein